MVLMMLIIKRSGVERGGVKKLGWIEISFVSIFSLKISSEIVLVYGDG